MSVKQEQIKHQIERWIQEHHIRPGDRLPSESALAGQFNVCRTTIRGAIRRLRNEGKVFVKHGSGTFITRNLQTIPSSLDRLYSIGDMIRSAGLTEEQRLEYIRQTACPEEAAEQLEMKKGEPVIQLERSRMANLEPVAHSINYIPVSIAGKTLEAEGFSGSLFQHLEQHAGIHIVGADSQIIVPSPTDVHCQKLLTGPESNVLLLKQIHYDEMNRRVLYSLDYVRSDIFTFWIRRTR
ncbi:GntR family transcriptional regulator [Paenibacillus wulumuqiensis]|uniref:GntR family transcriptional regulator n=1 Tax=Paenibacillus wulumuqiensis TaxID=1567107 RepID=UPI000619284C|nr:GntR family transcriptional regulator [Paenibacillus wulumuqiensis]